MKTQAPKKPVSKPNKEQIGQFTSEAELVAEKNRRFQEIFGKVDWEKAKSDGLIS